VHTLSQLVNNDLVRLGVTFYKEKQLERSSGTFEVFVLLHNTDISRVLEIRDSFTSERLLKRKLADNAAKERERESATKEREMKPLSDGEQAQLQRLLVRNKTTLQRNGEPVQTLNQRPASQFEVRDIFTGTGSVKMNKELAKGKRQFDGTTVQTYRKRRSTFTEIGPPATLHPPPDSKRRSGKSGCWKGCWIRTRVKRLQKLGLEENNLALLKLNQSFGSITDAVKLAYS